MENRRCHGEVVQSIQKSFGTAGGGVNDSDLLRQLVLMKQENSARHEIRIQLQKTHHEAQMTVLLALRDGQGATNGSPHEDSDLIKVRNSIIVYINRLAPEGLKACRKAIAITLTYFAIALDFLFDTTEEEAHS